MFLIINPMNNRSVCPNFFIALQGQEHAWYLDSGCSRHMTGCKYLLNDLVKKDGSLVRFRNDCKGRIMDFGLIQCKSVNFNDVSYISSLRYNLISISQLIWILDRFSASQCYCSGFKNFINMKILLQGK